MKLQVEWKHRFNKGINPPMLLAYVVPSVSYGIGTPWSRPTEIQALPRIKFVGGGGSTILRMRNTKHSF